MLMPHVGGLLSDQDVGSLAITSMHYNVLPVPIWPHGPQFEALLLSVEAYRR